MRSFLKYMLVCLLCLAMFIPSACAPGEKAETPSPDPEQTPATSQPVTEPGPTDAPVTDEPGYEEEPLPDIDPVPAGDVPAVYPDEETVLFYDLDGVSGSVAAVRHHNTLGYSIVYDAIHYERRVFEGMDSYWSEMGLYLSVSLLFDSTIDFVLDGLMLQENIEMAPRTTVVGADRYPAYTLYQTTEEGIYRQFWALDYNGSALLIEQSYPLEHEFADFHRAVQQAMMDSIVLMEYDAEAIDALQAVLNDGGSVILADSGESRTLAERVREEAELTETDMRYTAFAYCDLDGDGSVELILCRAADDAEVWFDILHYRDGAVYLYERNYRALLRLKTDGTFRYSDGAANGGFGALRFEQSDTVTEPITWVESEDGTAVRYFVEGVPAGETEFDLAMEVQERKSDVVWYAVEEN